MIKATALALAFGATLAAPLWAADQTASAPDAQVYFISPAEGDTVSSPLKVVFGLSGMGIAPAGTEKEMTGHHHLFIDVPPFGEGDAARDAAIPSDDNHKHFGGGQTETMLDLAPGEHTLQLVLGDWSHVPFDPPVTSDVITITVE
ncbi:hypothetical protein P775_02480 [Puniceibacterium antarcticum]|uniref:DUF4399 domain-containing protein n=1 Tax=Puniceibacterium antarcticum TaxID=1206336 RepID=A0A2G8RKD3_9RHOB|nr:DUF4399 domain-containing protein [Puniceibacterium antarcticum]PIL21861.1 hypothetical protein P775_02480 [Puniceibacterium antarcticum]